MLMLPYLQVHILMYTIKQCGIVPLEAPTHVLT